jgi:hypothetical protein
MSFVNYPMSGFWALWWTSTRYLQSCPGLVSWLVSWLLLVVLLLLLLLYMGVDLLSLLACYWSISISSCFAFFSVAFVPIPSLSQHLSLVGSCWFLYYCSQQHILEEKEEEEFVDLFFCGVVVLVVVVVVELVGSLMSSCRLQSRLRLR